MGRLLLTKVLDPDVSVEFCCECLADWGLTLYGKEDGHPGFKAQASSIQNRIDTTVYLQNAVPMRSRSLNKGMECIM